MKHVYRMFPFARFFQSYAVEGDGGGAGGVTPGQGGTETPPAAGTETPPTSGTETPAAAASKQDAFKRFLISKQKEEAKAGNPPAPASAGNPPADEDFDNLLNDAVKKHLQSLGLDTKLKDVENIKSTMQKEEFFKQFLPAGKQFEEVGLTVDAQRGGEILHDIEQNGFSPAHLILLANADTILAKLKTLPRSPMSSDTGKPTDIGQANLSMADKAKALASKFGIQGY